MVALYNYPQSDRKPVSNFRYPRLRNTRQGDPLAKGSLRCE
jgi:hypothetical protein